MLSIEKIEQINEEFSQKKPKEILSQAFSLFDNIALSFSGAEDVVLIDMALKLNKNLSVFTLDTGRLHPQTYRFIEKVRKHYEIDIHLMQPNSEALQDYVLSNGLFDFYENGHGGCCEVRKIEPLRRKLATVDAWITGQRRDQSPTRANVPVFQHDKTFSKPEHELFKVNPLANLSSEDVWNYIRMFDVPFNELHDQGFISIGCEPCTRAVGPNQHEREGRWWWEESTIKECGLHLDNLKT